MGKVKKLILNLSIGLFLMGLTGCDLIAKTPEGVKNTVVATVGSDKITKGEFDKRMSLQIAQYEAYYGKGFFDKKENAEYLKELKSQALEQMIDEKIYLQKAKELNLIPDEKTLSSDVDKKVDEAKKAAGDEKKFNEQLSNLKITIDDYKELVRNSIIFEKLYDNQTKDVKVTDQEITNYYHENSYDYTEKPNVMNVSHILVNTEEEAKKVKDEIDKGMKFEDAAKKYSTDPGSKDKGGELGDIYYSDKNYDKDFMIAAIALPEGKISTPVKSQFGYHIIKVNKKTEYPLVPLEKVKNEISGMLLEQKKSDKFQETINAWKEKIKIKSYEDRL
ncbi:foldase protein PrsA [Caloramator quimbayensis]|uniref:peptidylprolyl isomerase n=1 Tax=Caloramator quimbayensis TaxID=1147123 RepID=A0A1T4Y0U5_9CLOT|nr:peptidylprolyl isomerase [Caloramator quimbayensis]SKA95419.1 foldase protein PrsA [Caloramator quimbayensis]